MSDKEQDPHLRNFRRGRHNNSSRISKIDLSRDPEGPPEQSGPSKSPAEMVKELNDLAKAGKRPGKRRGRNSGS